MKFYLVKAFNATALNDLQYHKVQLVHSHDKKGGGDAGAGIVGVCTYLDRRRHPRVLKPTTKDDNGIFTID